MSACVYFVPDEQNTEPDLNLENCKLAVSGVAVYPEFFRFTEFRYFERSSFNIFTPKFETVLHQSAFVYSM
jgi:hypothetical protein